jgi:hypothetical protein
MIFSGDRDLSSPCADEVEEQIGKMEIEQVLTKNTIGMRSKQQQHIT